MKVLQINSFFTVGGPPKIVNGIYDLMVKNNHECKIAAAREKIYAEKDSIIFENNFEVNVNALKARLFDNEGFNAKSATKRLIKGIKQFDPDVIHLHNLHGYYINIELLFDFLAKYNKPVVWTLHDCWAMTGHCCYFTMNRCDKYISGCHKCPIIKEYPSALFFDNSKNNYNRKKNAFIQIKNLTITAPSQWLANVIKTSFLKDYPVKVISNGIDIEKFYPVESDFKNRFSITNKTMLLGVAITWKKSKGLQDFLDLASKLSEDYVIVLVGLAKEQIAELPKNIIGLQKTNSLKQLLEIYSAADLFVNPSKEETFGLVTLEALACGTPALVYNLTACPEPIDKKSGLVIQNKQDSNSMYEAIVEGKWRQLKSEDCILRAKEFDQMVKYMDYINLYEELCHEK